MTDNIKTAELDLVALVPADEAPKLAPETLEDLADHDVVLATLQDLKLEEDKEVVLPQ